MADPASMPSPSRAADRWSFDLDWLTPAVAVGGCFPIDRAAELVGAHGITAVVDLRAEACDDEAALRRAGLAFLHLPTTDLLAVSTAHLDRGVEWVRAQVEGGGKALIHCQHGIGRSALLALCVLVDQGWEPLPALAHAKDCRVKVSPSEAQYRGWAEWLRAHGHPVPDYHRFGCIAYRHLSQA
jgi:hypothetical protein